MKIQYVLEIMIDNPETITLSNQNEDYMDIETTQIHRVADVLPESILIRYMKAFW